eukprot:Clim_evm28s214 gene=Clim_evmTU28s214
MGKCSTCGATFKWISGKKETTCGNCNKIVCTDCCRHVSPVNRKSKVCGGCWRDLEASLRRDRQKPKPLIRGMDEDYDVPRTLRNTRPGSPMRRTTSSSPGPPVRTVPAPPGMRAPEPKNGETDYRLPRTLREHKRTFSNEPVSPGSTSESRGLSPRSTSESRGLSPRSTGESRGRPVSPLQTQQRREDIDYSVPRTLRELGYTSTGTGHMRSGSSDYVQISPRVENTSRDRSPSSSQMQVQCQPSRPARKNEIDYDIPRTMRNMGMTREEYDRLKGRNTVTRKAEASITPPPPYSEQDPALAPARLPPATQPLPEVPQDDPAKAEEQRRLNPKEEDLTSRLQSLLGRTPTHAQKPDAAITAAAAATESSTSVGLGHFNAEEAMADFKRAKDYVASGRFDTRRDGFDDVHGEGSEIAEGSGIVDDDEVEMLMRQAQEEARLDAETAESDATRDARLHHRLAELKKHSGLGSPDCKVSKSANDGSDGDAGVPPSDTQGDSSAKKGWPRQNTSSNDDDEGDNESEAEAEDLYMVPTAFKKQRKNAGPKTPSSRDIDDTEPCAFCGKFADYVCPQCSGDLYCKKCWTFLHKEGSDDMRSHRRVPYAPEPLDH